MATTYLCKSSVRDYHVYQSVEENLVYKREMSNPRDSYAVIVVKGEQTCQSSLAVYLLVDSMAPNSPGSRLHASISSLGRQDIYICLTNRGLWDIGRKRAGRVRKVAVDRLEVMQQCRSSTAARKRPEPVNLGLHVTNILCTIFHGLGLIRENSETLSHAKINTPMVVVPALLYSHCHVIIS